MGAFRDPCTVAARGAGAECVGGARRAGAGTGPAAAERVRSGHGPRLLDVRRLWAEPQALDSPRGQQVRARFPDAEIIPVDSHWKIDELHGNAGNVDRWIR